LPNLSVGTTGAIDRLEIEAAGLTFTGRACGPHDGRRVLLLHGFPQTSWAWRDELWALGGAGHRAVAPDLRGYCPDARPPDVADYATDRLVKDVLSLANAMDMNSFDLVGHDWGGMLAWLVASRNPVRVRSLTVVSTPHPLALQQVVAGHRRGRHGGGDPEQMARAAATSAFCDPDVPERLLLGEDGSGCGLAALLAESGLDDEDAGVYVQALTEPGAMTAALNWYRAMDRSALHGLRPVTVPTLYVWSTGDRAIGRAAAEATSACVAGPYTFEVLEGVSHWIPETAPDQLSEMLLRHLAAT
jgi:pimeloyl-ACP methyl ester carboxylesterase